MSTLILAQKRVISTSFVYHPRVVANKGRKNDNIDQMRSFEKVESRDNHRLKFARQVRDGKQAGYIFIEGRRLASEAISSGLVVRNCIISSSFEAAELVEALSSAANTVEVPERIFASIADTKNSQGIILVAERPSTKSGPSIMSALASAKLPLVIFLNEINNPSNLGALLRTAEAAGAAGVIASRNSADVYSPRSLRAAMGSAFRLAIWDSADPNEVFRWARENGLVPTATDASAVVEHTEVNWRTPRLLIFGSEAHGLHNLDRQEIQETIRIPMEPQVESLNLAVSAGVILFEARRQIDSRSE